MGKLNEVAELRGDGAIELIRVKVPERTERKRMRMLSNPENRGRWRVVAITRNNESTICRGSRTAAATESYPRPTPGVILLPLLDRPEI